MMQSNYGATPIDWQILSQFAGLTADLLPVVSNITATVSPGSAVTQVGKVPSEYNHRGHVAGMMRWPEIHATEQQISAWAAQPDYGICIQTRKIKAFDIDVPDRVLAARIYDALAQCGLPMVALRNRSNVGKFLVAVRCDDANIRKLQVPVEGGIVELLGTDNQFIAIGTHPSGVRYEWIGGATPTYFPEVSTELIERCWDMVVEKFGIGKVSGSNAPVKRATLDAAIDNDPIAKLLDEQGMVKGVDRDGKLNIACPFESEHTSASAKSATSYFPAHTGGFKSGHFKCLHAHCAGRSDDEFKAKLGLAVWGGKKLDTAAIGFGQDVSLPPVAPQATTTPIPAGSTNWLQAIQNVEDEQSLQQLIQLGIAYDDTLDAVMRTRIEMACKQRFADFGLTMRADILRKLLKPRAMKQLPDLNSEEKPQETMANVSTVCDNNGVLVRYNVIKKDDEILIEGASWSVDNARNASLTWVRSLCHKSCVPTRYLKNMITLIADKNQFNPVVEWVQSAPWDGVSRAEQFYDTVVENRAECGPEIKRLIMRKWAISAIAAAFSPNGIQARGVIVFQGQQYAGKTRWIDSLAPKDLEFVKTGRALNVHDKDSVKQIISCWISELGELDATFKKSDIAALKAFITNDSDELRRPYAEGESRYARRTVFAASVNEKRFLQDDTGNSRFWVISIDAIRHDHGLNMQQVWAEFYQMWRAGETHYMTAEQMALVNTNNETFMASDPISEMIESHLDWEHFSPADCEWMQPSDVLRWVGHKNPTKSESTLAGKAILRLNGGCHRKSNGRRLSGVPKTRRIITGVFG